MAFKYPTVYRDESIKTNYFGVEVEDPYRWLENPESEKTKKFIEEQNALTQPYLDTCPYREIIKKKITQLWNYPKFSTPFRHGEKYYQFQNTGLQNQSVIYVQDSLDDEAKVFFDPNLLSDDGTVALSGTEFSPNGEVLAYGLSSSGSDWLEIHFKNALTGNEYDEILKKVKFSPMSWMHDNKGFFYGAYLERTDKTDGSETRTNENQKLYYHQLGTDQSEDIVVFQFDDPKIRIGAIVSHCGKYLVISGTKGCKNNLLYFCKLNPNCAPVEKLKLTPVVTEFAFDYEYVTNYGSRFLFHTNRNSPNFSIMEIDFDNPIDGNWKYFITENEKDVLDWAYPINNDMLIVCYLHDVKNVLHLYNKNGEKFHDFNLPVGTISTISGKKEHKEMFFSFCSFLTPNIVYKVEFNDNNIETSVFHETKVGDFIPSDYETKQVFYKSNDNTEIPMFIINKKGFVPDGDTPCLLYGYGGFNVNLTPSFGVTRLVFIENFKGIYALANIRGGGEYGDNWHNGGRYSNKQNSFNDFQCAAKYLIDNNYTQQSKLVIQGGSNGGLLVAACLTQAPQLYGAVLCQAGVLDMLRFQKFTIGYAWTTDYGSSDNEEQFNYLYKYSPLHNIKPPKDGQQYPATFLLIADHDDRVVPLHSLKFIAELQYKIGNLPQQKNPLMIRIETRAGHGAGKPTTKIIDEYTDMFCFVSNALNIEFHS